MATDFSRFQAQDSGTGVVKEDLQIPDAVNGEEQLKELEATVERLKVLNQDRKEPFDDDIVEVPRLCRGLENILRHQQKEKMTFWSERKDYFHYLTEGTGDLKELDNLVKYINQNSTETLSGQGKGRALIRLCMTRQLLAECVQSAIANAKKTKDWYNPGALLLQPAHSSRLVNALYDLSDMKFKLPIMGVNLEEAWPSFVQKSFINTSVTSSSQKSKQSVFQSRKAQSKVEASRDPAFKLETAIEEKPSEVFVKQEIPFDIKLVSNLFSELRSILTDEFEGYTQESVLPEISVTKLDDITSGLSLLKDYIVTMSEDITDNTHKSHEVIKQLRKEATALNAKLKESNELATTCQTQLKSSIKMVESVKKENISLQQKIEEQDEQISSLQSLQQQSSITEEHQRDRRLLEVAECKVKEVEHELASQSDAFTRLQNDKETLEEECRVSSESLRDLRAEVAGLRTELEKLQNERTKEKERLMNEMETIVSEKNKTSEAILQEMTSAKELHEKEMSKLKEQVTRYKKRYEEGEEEKDLIKEELKSVQGMVEQETASLRFELSSNNMQLQQTLKDHAAVKKESSDLKQSLWQKTKDVSVLSDKCDKQSQEIHDLTEQLMISEKNCKSLQDDAISLNIQLTENTLNRDTIREESLKMQRELDDTKERLLTDTQRISQQNVTLSDENESLRKALQKLLEQKVSLWQHADELEQEQVSKGVWIDSKLVTECMDCRTVFNLFNRKHHCRSCGKVFCTACCENKVQLPSNRGKARVCRLCFNRIKSLRTPHAATLINTLQKDNDDLSSNGGLTKSSSEPINAFPGGVSMTDSNLVHLTPLDGSDESLLQHVRELISTPHNTSKHESLNSSVNEYSIDPLVTESVTTKLFRHGDDCSLDPDDEFCVIDVNMNNESTVVTESADDNSLDIQTLRAKLATLESSSNDSSNNTSITQTAVGTGTNSPLDDDIQEVNDLHVDGGGHHMVRVKVDTPRTVVSWQFSSQPRGIAMGLNYQENDEGQMTSILPEKRVMSHKTILVGEYVAQKAGVYTLMFNNSHSKYSGRLLSYKVWKRCQT